jgi:hypothetical protein
MSFAVGERQKAHNLLVGKVAVNRDNGYTRAV